MELIGAKFITFVKSLVVVFSSSLIACKKYMYVCTWLFAKGVM